MTAGGGSCRVRALCDCRVADGFGKHEFFTLQCSDANTDTGRRRIEVPWIVGKAVLEACALWRQIFWYMPRPPACCHCNIGNTDVCVNREPARAGVYWLPYRRKDMGIAVRFPAWSRDFSVLCPVSISSANPPPPPLTSGYRRLSIKVKILSHVHTVLILRMNVVVPWRYVFIDKCCFPYRTILMWNLCNILYITYTCIYIYIYGEQNWNKDNIWKRDSRWGGTIDRDKEMVWAGMDCTNFA
jgi:hypothetical protein